MIHRELNKDGKITEFLAAGEDAEIANRCWNGFENLFEACETIAKNPLGSRMDKEIARAAIKAVMH